MLTAEAIAAQTADPVKSVTFYLDSNSNLTFDSADKVLGKAHKTKTGWQLSVPASKLLTGNFKIFAVATGKDGDVGLAESYYLDVQAGSAPSISSLSAKFKAAKGKITGTLTLSAKVAKQTLSNVTFTEDTNGDGVLDSGDQILYTGSAKKLAWSGPFSVVEGTTYTFFAEVENTHGQWSSVETTTLKT